MDEYIAGGTDRAGWRGSILVIEIERGTQMETKYYVVSRIDGDYAWLKRTDAEEEPLFIARALLPEAIDEETKLKYELLQYEII